MSAELIIQDFQGKLNSDMDGTRARLIKGATKALVQATFFNLKCRMKELWKSIHGWAGYEVSSRGRLRSFWQRKGEIGRRGSVWFLAKTPKFLSLKIAPNGRKSIVLHRNGNRKTIPVSTLVLKAFVGPRPAGMYGCHGPQGLSSDSVKNLYWARPSRNNGEDRRRDKTDLFGEKHPRAKLSEANVKVVLKERSKGVTRHAIAKRFSVSPGTIGNIIYGRTWRHVTL